jgi:predicted enzyme related to lactoylglutathione lyase
MGERTQYTPGTFSWTDFSTPDVAAAKGFYGGLFGWEAEDLEVPGGGTYSMQNLGGRRVAALSPQPEQQRAAGVPPMWNSYITVESADAATARASELGADVHAQPFDVMEAGRMAVIQDPQGAFFMVWEPRESIGAGLVNAPGALCWNELASPDLEASAEFYRGLFGWTIEPFEDSPTPYLVIRNGERGNGGMREKQEQEPPYWLVYFAVEDTDAAAATISGGGGTLLVPPMDIDPGRFAVGTDPQGAAFGIIALRTAPVGS